jgi:phage terminase large subunit
MQNRHIIEDLQSDGVGRYTEIFADCAEPKSIKDIQDGGFNVIACDKDAPVKSDKLKFQLQWMQGWKLFVTKDSLNLIEELRNYTWAKNKDGETLNQPIDKFNHLLDAMRYAVWSKFGQNAGQGEYRISIKRKR